MAISNGKIVFTGTGAEVKAKYEAKKEIDLNGKSVFPGFNDAHCHFYGYGLQLNRVNLLGTNSWEENVALAKQYSLTHKSGWIEGRGWDQNDWKEKEFPTNEVLNAAFPDRPVFLKRIDGHAGVANDAALKIAGFTPSTKISGGELILQNGKLTGVLIDNAMDSLEKFIPAPSKEIIEQALLDAQKNCFAVGLTSVTDAGLDKEVIDIIDSLQRNGKLKMRVNAMLSDNEVNCYYYFAHGPYMTDRLTVRSFKFYADGALGSRGALMKESYSDQPNHVGLLLKPMEYFQSKFKQCFKNGFQVCTHCIGDSANKLILDLYGQFVFGHTDKRWRIEHAQIISPADMKKFSWFNIIPSIQPCFTTSDMYWAKDRIGEARMKGAYSWKSLLNETKLVACGSDFPVEDINPLYGFYAAITRQDLRQFPEGGFMPEEKLTREEALKGMTTWAAFAEFAETKKGKLVAGMFADFVVMDEDIMTMPATETYKAKVQMTFVNGELVYQKQ